MKVSRRDVQILLGVLGVLIVVIAYQFGFTKIKEQITAMESSNADLEGQITELQQLTAQKDKFEQEITKMEGQIQSLSQEFPSDFKTEDGIMMTVDMENKTELNVKSIEMGGITPVYELGVGKLDGSTQAAEDTTQEGAEEAQEARPAIVLYQSPYALNYEVTNNQLKEMLRFINDYRDRKVIDSLSASYNRENGKLTGSVNVNVYVLSGTGKEYQSPYVPNVQQGTDNIFGTVDTE